LTASYNPIGSISPGLGTLPVLISCETRKAQILCDIFNGYLILQEQNVMISMWYDHKTDSPSFFRSHTVNFEEKFTENFKFSKEKGILKRRR
jgi:hypothetical protein